MGSSPRKAREETARFENEVDEVIEPFFAVFGFESVKEEGFPVIDVYETSDNIFVEAELPGIDREMVRITVTDGELIVEGIKSRDADEGEKVKYLCIERSFGKFRRTVDVPKASDRLNVKARYEEGILIITIPKVKEQRNMSRRIKIE